MKRIKKKKTRKRRSRKSVNTKYVLYMNWAKKKLYKCSHFGIVSGRRILSFGFHLQNVWEQWHNKKRTENLHRLHSYTVMHSDHFCVLFLFRLMPCVSLLLCTHRILLHVYACISLFLLRLVHSFNYAYRLQLMRQIYK